MFIITSTKKRLRRFTYLLCCLGFAVAGVAQQKIPVRGTVQNQAGEPLPAVTIIATQDKEIVSSTSSADGDFVLQLSAPGRYDVVFSSAGYLPHRQTIATTTADMKPLIIRLNTDEKNLDEVVVTALGIKREQKALGYAAQSLNEKAVSDARSNNWVNSLSGKVAGLNIVAPGSGPLNSTRITLRGDASLNADNNNALIVVDGIPMNNKGVSSGVSNAYGAGSGSDVPIDFGNGISDINPDDIESITVLKGPGAAALYGSRAGNGAILITTKSGARKEKGIGITFNSNVSANTVLHWPDYQYEYGQGTGKALNAAGEKYYSYGGSADGASTSGTSSAYGPKFEGQEYFQYDPEVEGQSPERRPWVPYKNNIKDFWRTGYTVTNNIAMEGGNDKGSARASLTHSKNEWIMPNTGFERVTAALNFNFKISERLKVTAKASYTNKKSDNLPATGYNNQSIAYFMIFQNPNVDLNWYRPIWKKGQQHIDQIHPFSSFIDNPYLIAYEMTNSINSNAVIGNIAATYDFSKNLDLMIRSGIDLNNEFRAQKRPYSSANYQRGYYKEQNIQFYEINTDFLLSYRKSISKDHRITAAVGGNAMTRMYNRVDGAVEGLIIPGVYKLNNGISNPLMYNDDQNKKVNSLYGMATYSWRDRVFLDLTARNDWSSTLPEDNYGYFYPSVNTSFIISELVNLPAIISFAKTRFSFAQGGNDTRSYMTNKYYGPSDFPGSGSVATTLYNRNFKPEISNSFEAGVDLRFFKNRVSIDATVYRNITENQILEVPLDPTTGYSRALLNAGKVRNQGFELVLNTQPVAGRNFNWNSIITWSTNKNTVLELAEGMDGRQDIGYGGNATLQARIGGSTGDIYGFGFVRDPDGNIVYNNSGLPARPAEIQYIGSAYAKWRGGFRNEVNYKGLRMSVLIDGQYGGIVYSQSHHKMSEQGKLKHTLYGREENFIIGDGVVLGADGKYVENTRKVVPVDFYTDYYRRANVESNSFDASFIKLREVRLEYALPSRILGKSVFQGVVFAIYGRDLAMITSFPIFDPETAALNGSTILPGIEMGQLPSTRSFGANLTIKL